MDLEDVFCSKVRMKILKLLFQYRQMHTSALSKKLSINYETALKHLEFLETEGIIRHRKSGRTRFFRFSNTLKASAISELLQEWEKH